MVEKYQIEESNEGNSSCGKNAFYGGESKETDDLLDNFVERYSASFQGTAGKT